MNEEALETKTPKNWRTVVREAAPGAVSLLLVSVTYMWVGAARESRGLFFVGLVLWCAFLLLPGIVFVAHNLRASQFGVFKTWILLYMVVGGLLGQFLLAPAIRWFLSAVFPG